MTVRVATAPRRAPGSVHHVSGARPGPASACEPSTCWDLLAGLEWLYTTVQPDAALVEHCGARLKTGPHYLRFLPVGNAGAPLIVIAADIHRATGSLRSNCGRLCSPTPPLGEPEVLAVVAELESYGVHTCAHHTYALTATVALTTPPHHSLLAAVARWANGCPYHHSQVCDAPVGSHGQACPWRKEGRQAAVWPRTPWSNEHDVPAIRPANYGTPR
jgi:hypothetical protein